MEQRPGVQRHRGLIEAEGQRRHHCVDPQIAVAKHHALRAACRAASVEQASEIVVATAGVGARLLVRERSLVIVELRQPSSARRGSDHGGDAAAGIGELQRTVEKAAIAHQHRRLGIRHLLDHLGEREPGIDRHHDATSPQHGEIALDVRIAVGRQDRNPLAGFNAEASEHACEPRHPVKHLAMAEAALGGHERDVVGAERGRLAQARRQLHVVLPPVRVVA